MLNEVIRVGSDLVALVSLQEGTPENALFFFVM